MQFTFEVDLDGLFDGWGGDKEFQEAVYKGAINSVVSHVYKGETTIGHARNAAVKAIDELIKSKSNEIIAAVVESVSDKVARKKAVVELTPKASEVAKIDDVNMEYFMGLIDKAIAKRFGGK